MEDLGGIYCTVPNSMFLMWLKLFVIDFSFNSDFTVIFYFVIW